MPPATSLEPTTISAAAVMMLATARVVAVIMRAPLWLVLENFGAWKNFASTETSAKDI